MKYKHYETMNKIFVDQHGNDVITNPQFTDSAKDDPPLSTKRKHSGSSRSKQFELRDILKDYYEQSLQLQREALEIEREKLKALLALSQKK